MYKINLSKRKAAEKLVYDTMAILDPTGVASNKYRQMFSNMSNKEFEEFCKTIFEDKNSNFVLDIVDYERDLSISNIKKAANFLKVPLEEHIICPFLNMNKEEPTVTKEPILTGYVIVKRVQQAARKKNTASIETSSRSATTGQVIGVDKNGRSSDQDNIALITQGAIDVARELLGPRADDMVAKNQFNASIIENGYVSLEELDSNLSDKTTLNTVNNLFLGMGIRTDLINPDLLLPSTAIKK